MLNRTTINYPWSLLKIFLRVQYLTQYQKIELNCGRHKKLYYYVSFYTKPSNQSFLLSCLSISTLSNFQGYSINIYKDSENFILNETGQGRGLPSWKIICTINYYIMLKPASHRLTVMKISNKSSKKFEQSHLYTNNL